jgi:hypothetical protein
MLTFEGQAVQGIEAIVEKFKVRAKRSMVATAVDSGRTSPSQIR